MRMTGNFRHYFRHHRDRLGVRRLAKAFMKRRGVVRKEQVLRMLERRYGKFYGQSVAMTSGSTDGLPTVGWNEI